jgi:hypothetical protein
MTARGSEGPTPGVRASGRGKVSERPHRMIYGSGDGGWTFNWYCSVCGVGGREFANLEAARKAGQRHFRSVKAKPV